MGSYEPPPPAASSLVQGGAADAAGDAVTSAVTAAAAAAAGLTDNVTTSEASAEFDCPVYGENDDLIIELVKFWLEGVLLCAVGIFGMVGNLLSIVVLTKNELRNSFNMLLVGLAIFDSLYLVCSVLESVRKSFRAASQVQLLLYPHLLYPGLMIAMTGSVFMIVAIAFERYVSVHHPLDYNQAMNDPREIRRRLLRYFVPAVALSLACNVPKFFETEAAVVDSNATADAGAWPYPGRRVELRVTDMRVDPWYSSFVNWSQLVSLGIVPVCLLVYFNSKIYQDIRERERRRRPLAQREVAAAARAAAPSMAQPTPSAQNAEEAGAFLGQGNAVENGGCKRQVHLLAPERNGSVSAPPPAIDGPSSSCCPAAAAAASRAAATPSPQPQASMASVGANSISARFQVAYKKTSQHLVALTLRRPSAASVRSSSNSARSSVRGGGGGGRDSAGMSNARRRRVEDRLAVLFMGIVAAYLLCHFPRVLLNFYEMLVIEQAMACSRAGHRAFAMWAQITTSISHFLLVLNSSINILVYVAFNNQFRRAARELLQQFCCCLFSDGDGEGGEAAGPGAAAAAGGRRSGAPHDGPSNGASTSMIEGSGSGSGGGAGGGGGGGVFPSACCNRRAKTRKRVRKAALVARATAEAEASPEEKENDPLLKIGVEGAAKANGTAAAPSQNGSVPKQEKKAEASGGDTEGKAESQKTAGGGDKKEEEEKGDQEKESEGGNKKAEEKNEAPESGPKRTVGVNDGSEKSLGASENGGVASSRAANGTKGAAAAATAAKCGIMSTSV